MSKKVHFRESPLPGTATIIVSQAPLRSCHRLLKTRCCLSGFDQFHHRRKNASLTQNEFARKKKMGISAHSKNAPKQCYHKLPTYHPIGGWYGMVAFLWCTKLPLATMVAFGILVFSVLFFLVFNPFWIVSIF